MHRIIRIKAYEAEHGPHFNDEHARKAVNKMENEDGTRGQHWSLEETTALANQYGIRLDEKINKYDWYVALNMVYSDYYRVVVSMTGSNNTKYFVELAKAWMHDKDIAIEVWLLAYLRYTKSNYHHNNFQCLIRLERNQQIQ